MSTLLQLKALAIFADAARDFVATEDQSRRLFDVWDTIVERMIAEPVRGPADARAKLWLVDHLAEREWGIAMLRPALDQVTDFLRVSGRRGG